jgi:hypothetical protein
VLQSVLEGKAIGDTIGGWDVSEVASRLPGRSVKAVEEKSRSLHRGRAPCKEGGRRTEGSVSGSKWSAAENAVVEKMLEGGS